MILFSLAWYWLSLSSNSEALIAAALVPCLWQGREGDRGLVKELMEVRLVILQLAPGAPHPLVHLMLRVTASGSWIVENSLVLQVWQPGWGMDILWKEVLG